MAGTFASLCLAPTLVSAQSSDPIKIGAMYPLSGAQELVGKQALTGVLAAIGYLNENGGVNGRKIELIVRDDAADPNRAVANVNELAELGANLIIGGIQTAVVLAVKPILPEADAILISTAAFADQLTTTDFVPNYFRISDSASAISRAQAKFVLDRYPNVTKWTGIVPDAAFGKSGWEAFHDQMKVAFEAAGKQIEFVDPVLYKFGATDFRNQIAMLASSDAKGLYVFGSGSDTITFFGQAGSTGVLKNFEVMLDAGGEAIMANALGNRVPDGLWTQAHWNPESYGASPMTTALIERASKELGGEHLISGYVGQSFNAVIAYARAIEKAKSSETKAVIKALEGLTFEGVKGAMTFRAEDHQAVEDVNFFQLTPASTAHGWTKKDSFVAPGAEVTPALVAR